MSEGNRDGKIVDGQSYNSVLPEAYAKVKHQRDQVVEAFNKLKERQRDVEGELAEVRRLLEEALEAGGRHTFGNTLYDEIAKLV